MAKAFRLRLQSLHSFRSGYVFSEESCFLVEVFLQSWHRRGFVAVFFLARFFVMVSSLVASLASASCERFLYCSGVSFFT